MPDYKLIYFNAEGRAELIRVIFTYGGIEFEDERIEFSDWAERKSEFCGGQLPVLMVDDMALPESLAIARYAAKCAGLVPEDDLEAAYCDALVDKLSGLVGEYWRTVVFSKADPDEKQRVLTEDLVPNKINPCLDMLNEKLTDNEWFVSDQTTWADIAISLYFGRHLAKVDGLLEDYPEVKSHVEKVMELEPIAAYIEAKKDA